MAGDQLTQGTANTIGGRVNESADPPTPLTRQEARLRLLLGDCLDIMRDMPDGSVDMVMADLPYGTTYADWDRHIPMAALWSEYLRLVKGDGAIVLTASMPFTAMLVASRPDLFRCEWIWDKVHGANFANANRQPLKTHESVLVFARGQPPYFPIKVPGPPNHKQGKKMAPNVSETRLIRARVDDDLSGMKHPKSIVTIPKHSSQCGHHPTQKPVDLGDYFIRTYSRPGDLVLDNAMGSGSFGIAALLAGRRFVGIEKDPRHFETAQARIEATCGLFATGAAA